MEVHPFCPPDDFSESPLLSRKVAARRAGDDGDLVFDPVHEVLLSGFYFPMSDFIFRRLLSQVASDSISIFLVPIVSSDTYFDSASKFFFLNSTSHHL